MESSQVRQDEHCASILFSISRWEISQNGCVLPDQGNGMVLTRSDLKLGEVTDGVPRDQAFTTLSA